MATTYSTGTISVGSASTTVTGVGTAWNTAGLEVGDRFVAAGLVAFIASIDSATQITLTRAWPGGALSGANYDIEVKDDLDRAAIGTRLMLQQLSAGKLTSLVALAGGANKLPYFSGANTFAQTDITTAARAILGLTGASGAKLPVITAVGTAALRDILGTVSHSAGVPTGAIVERGSNANGEYVRFADGTQICTSSTIAIPATNIALGSVFRSETVIWTFPASFVAGSTPVVTGEAQALHHWITPNLHGNNTAAFRVMSAVPNSAEVLVQLTAIGRWF